MASEVAICNIALSALGSEKITALEEDNARARACNLRYEDIRDATFRAHHWNSLQGYALLVVDEDAPIFQWDYSYQLPVDCLKVIRMDYELAKWQVLGRKLYTGESPAKIKYTKRVTDPNEFDVLLIQAIGQHLAWAICEKITKDTDLKAQLWRDYLIVLAEARSVDGQEGALEIIQANDWLDARN